MKFELTFDTKDITNEMNEFNMEEQRKKEIDEIFKETERKPEEKSYEEHFMSLED